MIARDQLLDTIDCTELVTVRIAHIGQMHPSHGTLAQPWRIFTGLTSMRRGRVMEFLHLFGRAALKAYGETLANVAGSLLMGSLTQKVLPSCL